jgi:endoglucanase
MNVIRFSRAARPASVLTCAMLAALALTPSAVARSGRSPQSPVAGVNLAGAEFGNPPGRPETDYHYPSEAEFAWAKSRHFAVVRLPFLWERLQPALGKDFDAGELERLRAAVSGARKHGLSIILDVHDYGRYRGAEIGTAAAPDSAFADLWRRLATIFGGQDDVIFGLMNEPHDQPVARWAASAQAALDAVRAAGACNLTLVPGANWTGAHSWNVEREGVSNALAMAKIVDPGAHAFEFHQYLDEDHSGTHAECRKPEEVVAALSTATKWLREHKAKGFLGEFGAGPDANCQAGLDGMLKHMRDNSDIWMGWAWWAAGAWWPPTYPLNIGPTTGPEKPQMKTLAKWIGKARMPGGCSDKDKKR